MIYLDNHATTPCDPEVIKAMLPYFNKVYGNPSSTIHEEGRKGDNAVKKARRRVAKLIGSTPREIVFTSGATESNNIALQGLERGSDGSRKRIVTTPIEHKAILNQCKVMAEKGYEIIYLPVDHYGTVNISSANKLIDKNTLVVSVQTASNEIGTIQPLAEIAEIAHKHGAYFHTDAAQAVGKIPVDVNQLGVDLLSISAHKMYGPKGVGALFVRGGAYAMPIKPLFYGGEQEFNLRSGTLNVPGIVGFGMACELCGETLEEEIKQNKYLRNRFEAEIQKFINVKINGALENRLPNNSNLTFDGVDAEALIVHSKGLAISTGSACTSGAIEPSHVLEAIGLTRDEANSTLRIGFGRFNTEEEIISAVKIIIKAFNRIAKFS